jgi:hypothetical protein
VAPRHFELLCLVDFNVRELFKGSDLIILDKEEIRVERLCLVGCHSVRTDLHGEFKDLLQPAFVPEWLTLSGPTSLMQKCVRRLSENPWVVPIEIFSS